MWEHVQLQLTADNCHCHTFTHLLFFPTHNPPSLSVSRRGAACPVELLLVCVLGVYASWRASYVLWRPAARHLCSPGFPVWSCRAAVLSSCHAFAFSGPIKLSDSVRVQVRRYTHTHSDFMSVHKRITYRKHLMLQLIQMIVSHFVYKWSIMYHRYIYVHTCIESRKQLLYISDM